MLKRTRLLEKFLPVVLALTLGLLAVSVVYAVFITVDTNDGVVDSNWGTAFVTDPAGDSVCAAGSFGDITNAYIGSSGTGTTDTFYFRVQGTGLSTGFTGRGVAHLDCNDNGIFTDSADRQVVYVIDEDSVYVLDGPGNFLTSDPFDSTFGERIGTTDVEFKATIGDGTILGACASSQIGVYFASRNAGQGATCDTTSTREYNSPTAVTQLRLNAQTATHQPIGLLLGVSMLALGGWVLVWRTRRAVS
jgi:hypothetical protein